MKKTKLYTLPISTYNPRYSDKKVILDKDIYDLLEGKSLQCIRMGGKLYIRVYQGQGVSSIDINDYIIPCEKYKEIVLCKDDFFDRRRSNLYKKIDYKSDYSKNTTIKYGNKYKGVSGSNDKYVCTTYLKGSSIHIGHGNDPLLLAKQYDACMTLFFKDRNPYLNFPEEDNTGLLPKETYARIAKRIEHIKSL